MTGIWLFIETKWSQWKVEIIRYGVAALLFSSALCSGKFVIALIILGGVGVMIAVQKWGRKYQVLGDYMTASAEKKQELIPEIVEHHLKDSGITGLANQSPEDSPPKTIDPELKDKDTP